MNLKLIILNIVGPNGIFVIETKNLNGIYWIEDKNWYYKRMNKKMKSYSQPGKQVMANAMALKDFLNTNGVDFNGLWITSIVTLIRNNYKVIKTPKYYNILSPSSIPEFIINRKIHIDQQN